MEHLCSVAQPFLNYINLSAIITATAQLWTTARAKSSFQPSANMAGFDLKQFYSSILLQLEPMLPDVGAQAVSNILWSSAKLGLNPDAFVPGMTDALAATMLQLTKDKAGCQPNAQQCANFLWAFASMGHQPADKGLIDAVCQHFVRLIKHRDVSKRPNAQSAANLLWALASLGHQPADKGLVDAVSECFVRLIKHHDVSKQPNAQEAANLIWALASLGHQRADKGLIDAVCEHFVRLVKHHDISKRPNAQGAANLLWALASLGHQPEDKGLIDAVCNHFVRLIKHHDVSKRPNAQGAANVIWALGELNHEPPDGAASAILERLSVLCALEQLGLAFTANVPLSGYWADAVLQPQDGVAAPVVLVPESYSGRFSNQEKRLTGRAVFRRALLAKQGKLVLIPEQELSRSLGDLADYIQQQVEDVTGDSLKPYIMS
ncbi:MAG: hypothetical protein FRX49_08601 [Trebouxia sp. A1-2]|nr:MAG: hypothetical protein FRX49_08601 [Trebouxia sp. A1-2]